MTRPPSRDAVATTTPQVPATIRPVPPPSRAPVADTAARQRLLTDLLGWGQPRPVVSPETAGWLQSRLEEGLAPLHADLVDLAATSPRRTLVVTRSMVRRSVCDGWSLDPLPYRHTRASVRGSLVRDAIASVWSAGTQVPPTTELVEAVWHDAASRRPGDPSSLSAWLNGLAAPDAAKLRTEVAELVDDFREVWPSLPDDAVRTDVARPVGVSLAGGLVTLRTTPDLVLASRREDGLARALLVDVTTGRPRPEQSRAELRFAALLVTLASGRPPFRWATYYVAEGRFEAEELGAPALERAARTVLAVVTQRVRSVVPADEDHLRLQAGEWCAQCRRESACPVAAAAR